MFFFCFSLSALCSTLSASLFYRYTRKRVPGRPLQLSALEALNSNIEVLNKFKRSNV